MNTEQPEEDDSRGEANREVLYEAFRLMQEAGLPTNYVPNRADRRLMAKQMRTNQYQPGKK